MNEEMTYTYDLAATASAYHDAETRTEKLAREMAAAVQDMVTTRPDYFAALAERIGGGVGVRALQRDVKKATGRSATSVERDIARVVVMVATGWDDAETVRETPNVGQANGPGAGALKSAVAGLGKRDARAAVRALYAAPVDDTDTGNGDTGGGEDGDGEDGPGTSPGPDAGVIHDALRAYLVDYIGQHESPSAGVKNAARILAEAAALCEAADEPATV